MRKNVFYILAYVLCLQAATMLLLLKKKEFPR